MHKPKTASAARRASIFISLVLALSLLITACGGERIFGDRGKTGEYYGSGALQNNSPEAAAEQSRFTEFCDSLFRSEASATTLDLHYLLTSPEDYGITPGECTLGTCSLSEMISVTADAEEMKKELEGFNRRLLSREQNIVYDTLTDNLDATIMGSGMELYYQPLTPTTGIQAQLPILLAEYYFTCERDVEDYLGLLSQIDRYYSEILEFEKQKSQAGVFMSDASADLVIESCRGYLMDPENNFLTETFEERLNKLPSIDLAKKEELLTRHVQIIKDHFLPAYSLLIDGLTALKGTGIHDTGLAGYRDGKKYYKYLLRTNTGTSYTVSQLKKAIQKQIDNDIRTLQQLTSAYPDLSEQASASIVQDSEEILIDLKRQITVDFPELPDYDYDVKNVPESLEEFLSPAFYLTAPIDNLDQNVIYINNGSESTKHGLFTTLAHEGFPGHLYQTVYFRSHNQIPLLSLLSCSGFCEGWATYVEYYAYGLENGFSEPVSQYLVCNSSIMLGIYSLLDIGINYEGWDLDRCEELLLSFYDLDEETMMAVYQTLVDSPVTYLKYYNGYLELLDMRDEAKRVLKNRFHLKEFHRFILDMGPVPFSVIRPYFKEWLKNQR